MSGLIHLTVNGVMNTIISGCPTYSHFLSNYKRNSNFSFEIVEKKSTEKATFGKTICYDIPTDEGDLLNNVTLEVELTSDQTHPKQSKNYKYVANDFGASLVEKVELLIGGQTIEVLTSDYIRIHQTLYNTSDDQRRALMDMSGHSLDFPYLEDGSKIKILLDIPFYFYRNTSRNIPLCALNKHSVQIKITFAREDVIVNNVSDLYPKQILNTSLYVKYIYISALERNYIMSGQIEHVIEQLQVTSFDIKHVPENQKKSVMINFVNPVKELYFFTRTYTDYGASRNIGLPFTRMSMKLNNAVCFDNDGVYFRFMQPYFNHSGLGWIDGVFEDKIHMYSFAINPESNFPVGYINMSRIINKEFTFYFDPTEYFWTAYSSSQVHVYARSYNILCFRNGLGGLKF